MRHVGLMAAALLGCCGCFLVDRGPRRNGGSVQTRSSVVGEQANLEACTRVYGLGQRILAANKELPQQLVFCAVGKAEPELFHHAGTRIIITQGLVELCPTDDELAAVLCVQLGRMVAEREAIAPSDARQPAPRPPIEPVTFRSDGAGPSNADPMHLRELAAFEQEKRKQSATPRMLDPMELARQYLERSGFKPDLIDSVRSQLRAAADHSDLEQHMLSPNRLKPLAPPS